MSTWMLAADDASEEELTGLAAEQRELAEQRRQESRRHWLRSRYLAAYNYLAAIWPC